MSSSGCVLVTGSSGFVGRRVVARLVELGADVVECPHRWSDMTELAGLVTGRTIDRCIHLGWYAEPNDYLVNAAGNFESLDRSLELVDLLGQIGCRHLVVAGTCAEYAPSDGPLTEDDAVAPWSVYGAAKASLHLLLDSSWRPDSLTVCWARLFNVSGPGESPERLVPRVVCTLLNERAIDLSPGDQLRDYLDVADVAAALVSVSDCGLDLPVNVCAGVAISLGELLDRLCDTVGADRSLLRFGARPYAMHDPMTLVGQNDRLRRLTGWTPAYDLDAMVNRAVEYWRTASL